MSYVISNFAGWIFIGALGIGILTGLLTWARKPRGSWLSGWLSWGAIAFVIGLFAAIFKLVAGRGGLWLETELLMFAAYIVGCVIGSALRGLFAAAEPVLPDLLAGKPAVANAGAAAAVAAFAPAPENAPLAIDSSAAYPGRRPAGLGKPDGAPDDLTAIAGIGSTDQKMLNDLGIHHVRQVADWAPENALWINHHMARPGRVEAEGWISKAKALATGGGVKAAAAISAAAATAAAAGAASAAAAGTAGSSVPATAGPAVAGAGKPGAASATLASRPAGAGVDGGNSAASGSLAPAAAEAGTPGDIHAAHPGQRPAALAEPRAGKADDLRLIRGVSPVNRDSLNRIGIYHYDQIAKWKPEEAQWVNSFMGAPGRVERDGWQSQARLLDQARKNEASMIAAGAASAQASAADAAKAKAAAAESARVAIVADAARAKAAADEVTSLAAAADAAKAKAASDEAARIAASAAPAAAVAAAGAVAATASAVKSVAAETIGEILPVLSASELTALDGKYAGKRPAGLPQPRGGEPDDLLKIRGVGKSNLHQLHALGIFHFDQISKWTKDELRWVGSYMAFPGRLEKEDWIGQAKHYAQRRAIELANRAATLRDHAKK